LLYLRKINVPVLSALHDAAETEPNFHTCVHMRRFDNTDHFVFFGALNSDLKNRWDLK